MLIIGLDYHPSVQQIVFVDKETGEYGERRLAHTDGEAERFYRELKQSGDLKFRPHDKDDALPKVRRACIGDAMAGPSRRF